MLLEFPSFEAREDVVRGSPYQYGSRRIMVERHEEADNRFFTDFSIFTDVAATDFPLEHWIGVNIRAAFSPHREHHLHRQPLPLWARLLQHPCRPQARPPRCRPPQADHSQPVGRDGNGR